ncbi:unnamed protein product [Prunus armeniaca]|uniref:Uncharacterized protein n=1 Tax=Prunus armeniaca TaxID=36596 RepID=A0A6J5WE59_PRUAR|nr:unnamed protein product [Prunus armeniaca]
MVTVLFFVFWGGMGVLRNVFRGARQWCCRGWVGWGSCRSKKSNGTEGDFDTEMVDCGLGAGDG